MSSQYAQPHPHQLSANRTGSGALLTGLSSHLANTVRYILQVVEASNRSRANREMLILADGYQHSHPKLARELRSYVRGASSY